MCGNMKQYYMRHWKIKKSVSELGNVDDIVILEKSEDDLRRNLKPLYVEFQK